MVETANERVICLYLCDMPPGVQNDKPCDDDVMYFENVIECFEDETCDKHSVFASLEKEKALFMKKTFNDIVEHNSGAYCKNHVLIDALLMYKTYVELVDESAFGNEILESCANFVSYIFKLFRLQSKIIVVLPLHINLDQDNLSALLKHLLQFSIIEIVKST
ncbi:p18 [Euproctis pseudoconspersa nucleopolyhedrovirus]|uniref:p18 n=1 Tax=Euproctis pseudoconspersa nucleopolyhedrovirus TaxID=307467 RepID=C3TWY8_9ABAC|nr:p18 [Euproctis pseudoconspersa nucleopolyhedrovirus]ACO53530.1 p18 [Euproctis pseudoconspersa nucleopolyhedrovirus]QUJ09270.1 p18 protein [Gynaephora ruoergensis nucleopolyhedrovirus]